MKKLFIFIALFLILLLFFGMIFLFKGSKINNSEIAFKNVTISADNVEIKAFITNSSKHYLKCEYDLENGTLSFFVYCRYITTEQTGIPTINIPIETESIEKIIFCGNDGNTEIVWERAADG